MIRKLEYILRRAFLSFGVLLALSIVVFILTRVVPSDPAVLYLGPRPRAEQVAQINEKFGFNQPLITQYIKYMERLIQGDWGDSIATKRPVLQEIQDRLPATLELLFASMVLMLMIGIPLGVISAQFKNTPIDVGVRISSLVGVSMPAFWLGILLQLLFFYQLNLLPITGRVDSTLRFTNPITVRTGFFLIDTLLSGNWAAFWDVIQHLILPALTLAAYPIGLIARMTRASMLEVIEQSYIRTARAYGIPEATILYRYALKNAIVPTLTVLGLTIAYLLTGAFYVEVIFNWPGLGTFTVRSLLNVDYPAIMGITLFGAAGYIFINLVVDLLQAWIDPRISLE